LETEAGTTFWNGKRLVPMWKIHIPFNPVFPALRVAYNLPYGSVTVVVCSSFLVIYGNTSWE